jgi:hypothetical protein
MTFRHTLAVLATTAVLPLGATLAQATPLSSLVGGSTLTQGDVTFGGFFFDDRFGDDDTGAALDRQDPTFPGDRVVAASQVDVTTTSTDSSVTLKATVDPAIGISGGTDVVELIFDFILDFNVSVSSTSSREITGVTLGLGNLFATGNAFSEVIFDIVDFQVPEGNDLEIFEAPQLSQTSQTSDTVALAATRFLAFRGDIEGNTRADDATAGFSTFSLTFDLEGTAPPPPIDGVVPVPPALPLALSAFAGFALLRRARRG